MGAGRDRLADGALEVVGLVGESAVLVHILHGKLHAVNFVYLHYQKNYKVKFKFPENTMFPTIISACKKVSLCETRIIKLERDKKKQTEKRDRARESRRAHERERERERERQRERDIYSYI